MKATVQTANISGPSIKHLSIYSNDRVTPVLAVEISINVVPNDVVTKDTATMAAAPNNAAPK